MVNALHAGHIAGAAVDVVCDEHQLETTRNHALIEYARPHDNLLITPHIGGAAYEAVEKADLFVIRGLQQVVERRYEPV